MLKAFLNILGYVLELGWIGSFLYAAYCLVQAFGNRKPQRTRHQSPVPTLEDFTPLGRRYLGQALRAAIIAVGVILLATIIFWNFR